MRYEDFIPEDRRYIDLFLEQMNESPRFEFLVYPEDLEDDEMFFCTEEQIRLVTEKWMQSPGSYGTLARELDAYLSADPALNELTELDWGLVMRVEEDLYLFQSNSWSDSGLFLR